MHVANAGLGAGVAEELLWFIKGSTDARELQAKKIHIWDGNSSKEYLTSIGQGHRCTHVSSWHTMTTGAISGSIGVKCGRVGWCGAYVGRAQLSASICLAGCSTSCFTCCPRDLATAAPCQVYWHRPHQATGVC